MEKWLTVIGIVKLLFVSTVGEETFLGSRGCASMSSAPWGPEHRIPFPDGRVAERLMEES